MARPDRGGECIEGMTRICPSRDSHVTTGAGVTMASRRTSGGGKGNAEGRSRPGAALDLDRPAHRLGEMLGDREAQAGAALPAVPGAADAVEALQDPAEVLRRYPDRVVPHGHHHPSAPRARR